MEITKTASTCEPDDSELFDLDSLLEDIYSQEGPKGPFGPGPGLGKVKDSTRVLSRMKRTNGGAIKKENLRNKVMRKDAKCIRRLLAHADREKGTSEEKEALLEKMKGLLDPSIDMISGLIHIDQLLGKHPGFTDDFIRDYYFLKDMRKFHRYYTDYVFAGRNISALKDHYKLQCCSRLVHQPSCFEIWEDFHGFLNFTMFEEIQLGEIDERLIDRITGTVQTMCNLYGQEDSQKEGFLSLEETDMLSL
jgi:hypothetical protein